MRPRDGWDEVGFDARIRMGEQLSRRVAGWSDAVSNISGRRVLHPGRDLSLHHHGSSAAGLVAIEQVGQGHHQKSRKTKDPVDVDIGQSLGLRLKLLI